MSSEKRYGRMQRKPDEILKDKPVTRYERGAGGRFAPRAAEGGDRPARPAGDRPQRSYGDRPARPAGDRPPRAFGDRPARPYGDRPQRPYGDRPARPAGDRPPRAFGDRPARPYGDRPPRPAGDRPPRAFGDRPPRTFGDRPPRPYGDRPARPYGDRPQRSFGDRPPRAEGEDRPRRPFGDRPPRPAGDRPARPYGDRPPRAFGDRPPRAEGEDRPRRPYGDRPARPYGDRPARPYGDRPKRTYGDRPARPAGDRPTRAPVKRPDALPLPPDNESFESLEPFDVLDGTLAEVAEHEGSFAPVGAEVDAYGTEAPELPAAAALDAAAVAARPKRTRAKPPAAAPVAEPSEEDGEAAAAEAAAMPGDRIEGRNPVLEALKAGRTLNKLWVQKGQHDPAMQRILSKAIAAGVVIQELDKRAMDKLAVTHGHQGLIAQVAAHDYVEVDELLAIAKRKGEPPFLLVLDELKESYNLGSILRIADAAGVHGVIIPERRSVALDAAVAKASAGAVEHVAVARVGNIVQTLESLKEQGVWIAGTDADAKGEYSDADFKGPLAIVVGSEGEGLGHGVREHCDFLVGIPMAGQVNSLNAAVATGIVVFEAARQRRAAAKGR